MTPNRVLLHPLTFVADGPDVVVGRPDIESYAVFPVDGAELLRRLVGGWTVPEAAAWYERTYAEPVDVEDFLGTLHELGFARDREPANPGRSPAGPLPADPAGRPVRLQRVGRAVFSPVAGVLYVALLAVTAAVLWRSPSLRPAPAQVFFTGSLVVVQLTLILTELPLIFLHESAHVLAGRRLGLTSRLGVGRRLYFVVFETTLTKLLSVPRRQRYLPLAAGMLTDAAVWGSLVLIAAATRLPDGSLSLVGRAALAVGYLTLVRIAWQFLFFMETDVHHLLGTALRVTDLGGATSTYLRVWGRRVLRRPEPAGAAPYLSGRDRATLRWFGPLTLVASVVLTVLAAFTTVPVLFGFVHRIAAGIASGGYTTDFWDAVLSLLVGFGQFGVLGLLAVRARRRDRRARRQRPTPPAQQATQQTTQLAAAPAEGQEVRA